MSAKRDTRISRWSAEFVDPARFPRRDPADLGTDHAHRDGGLGLLCQAVARTPTDVVDATLYFTVSIGVAELRAGDSLGMLLRRADAALNAAKLDGRNRVNGSPDSFPA